MFIKKEFTSSCSSPNLLTYNEKSYNSFTHLVKKKNGKLLYRKRFKKN